MFTTQHYRFLAERFNTALKALWNSDEPDGIQVYTLLSLAETMAITLEMDNRHFNRSAFYTACTIDTPYSMSQLDSYRLSYLGGIQILQNNVNSKIKWAGYSDAKPRNICTCKGTLIPTHCVIHNNY